MPEGNKGGHPPATRTLAEGRTRPPRILAERPCWDREVDHHPDVRRELFRGRKAWRKLLLLTGFQG